MGLLLRPLYWPPGLCMQVYTYLLRPLTAPGRPQDLVSRQQQSQQHQSSTSSSGSDPRHPSNQQQHRQGSTGLSSGRQGSGGETVVGYELQLVMEYCPLVRAAADDSSSRSNCLNHVVGEPCLLLRVRAPPTTTLLSSVVVYAAGWVFSGNVLCRRRRTSL